MIVDIRPYELSCTEMVDGRHGVELCGALAVEMEIAEPVEVLGERLLLARLRCAYHAGHTSERGPQAGTRDDPVLRGIDAWNLPCATCGTSPAALTDMRRLMTPYQLGRAELWQLEPCCPACLVKNWRV